MSNILIIGASGFLGQAIVKKLLNEGLEFGTLSRNPLNLSKKIIKHSADIMDAKEIELIISKYEVIINCAGQITNPIHQCLIQNTDGIRNIVKAVKKHKKKLIHFSSVGVYGSSEYVDENSTLNPETVYGCIKYFAESIISQDLKDSLILRVSNIYGSNQKKGITHYIAKQYSLNNKKIFFNNNGQMLRYYLDVDDLANIIYRLINTKNAVGTFNIIGPCKLTIKELILKFEFNLNYKFNPEFQNIKPVENINIIDDSKIKTLLQYDFKRNIDIYIRNQIN